MKISGFAELNALSDTEIYNAIREAETELFNLRFKKATRQSFKSHEVKRTKRRVAQLKTFLTLKLQN